MPNTIDIYQPRYLAEVVRSAPPVHTFLRDTFFTNIKTFATEEVDIDIVKGDREMAAFVHPKMGAETMEEEGYETKSYKPPMDNRRYQAGEFNARDLPNGVRYHGYLTDSGLEIYSYKEVYVDRLTDPAHPTIRRMIPDNAMLMISPDVDFMRAYGLCSYYNDAKQLVTVETPRLLNSYIGHKPERRVLEAFARPLPIPDKVDSWLVATVC